MKIGFRTRYGIIETEYDNEYKAEKILAAYKAKQEIDVGFYYAPYIPTNILQTTKKEEKMGIVPPSEEVFIARRKEKMETDISSEEFNRWMKEYYDNFSAHWDKALNAYEKLVVNLELPETPIESPNEVNEGRWFEENAECCGEIPSTVVFTTGSTTYEVPEPQGEDPNQPLETLNAEADIAISDFVRDTFNYYGEENLFNRITYYHFVFCEMSKLNLDAKKELNDLMANEAKTKKANREKKERSQPLWNALKVS